MTDILQRTTMPKRSGAQLAPAAFAGMLAMFVAADTASAESLQHLRNELKIRSELGKTRVPAPAPPLAPMVEMRRDPNPDEPGYVAPPRRGPVHRYQGTECHDGTCVSE
jgi:hypothetical protein